MGHNNIIVAVERLSNQPDRLMRSLMTSAHQVGPNSEHFLPL